MLRISGPKDAAPPEPTPEAAAAPEVATTPEAPTQLDPETAGYKGPDQGPFQCDHCEYFNQDGSCTVVSGPIDPAGICNVFTSQNKPSEPPTEPSVPAEPPTEPPAGA